MRHPWIYEISEIIDALKFICSEVKALNATKLAIEAGSVQSTNVVMVGALSKYLPLKKSSLIESIKNSVPEKTIEVNIRAFELGRNI
ncbi:MAG: 2-oxoacid:acceptor oxidoreductase family protein [Candidatus Syntropharchaeia archaeon]